MSRIKFHTKHVDTLKKYGTMVFTNVPQKHQWVSFFDAANPDPEDSIGAMAIEALEKQIKRESLDCGGLKPCPFCGGEAFGKPEGDYWEITCEECGCAKQGQDHDSAMREWNARI